MFRLQFDAPRLDGFECTRALRNVKARCRDNHPVRASLREELRKLIVPGSVLGIEVIAPPRIFDVVEDGRVRHVISNLVGAERDRHPREAGYFLA